MESFSDDLINMRNNFVSCRGDTRISDADLTFSSTFVPYGDPVSFVVMEEVKNEKT